MGAELLARPGQLLANRDQPPFSGGPV